MVVTNTATHWGSFRIASDGKRITEVLPFPGDPEPSVIGQGLKAATECRVERPAVRRSWLVDGPGSNPEGRGSEPFVEVEWDEALDLLAAELIRVRSDHGNQAIYGGSYGWGSSGRFHAPSAQLYRFLRLFGGSTHSYGTYSSAACERLVPYVLGTNYYRAVAAQTSWSVIADHTELFVSFGSLRLTNAQVTYGGQGPHHTETWITAALERDTRFVNIGPIADDELGCDRSAGEAGVGTGTHTWVPIRPGTDVPLMAALAHRLITTDRADRQFLDSHCQGWDRLEDYLTGRVDGQAKDSAWAAAICDIDAAAIDDLADQMASARTLINLSLSVQRGDHGEQPYWMAIALAAVLGQIGLPGGGIAFPFGANGNVGSGQKRKPVPGLPIPPMPDGMPLIPVSRVVEMLENPQQTYRWDGETSTYPDIRLVYWAGGNVFHHHQDLNRLAAAWQRPDTVVVHEPFWTPMARWADIVLPATTPLERNDLGGAESQLVAMQAAIEPQGSARDDFEIFCGLADRVGVDHAEGKTADEWLRALYDQFRDNNDYAPDFDTFWANGYLTHPDITDMGDREQVYLGDFRADPDTNPLPTPSGRIELFSEVLDALELEGCAGHPKWFEPYERLGTAAADRHPLHLVSNQPTTRLHSQYDHAEVSRSTKIAGREPIRLNPADAEARGLTDGDVVRVFNDRGACLAGVAISDALRPGVVQLATGAWYDPDETGLCKHGNPNVLTRDKGTSELAQGTTAHTCLVEIERFEGRLPPITAFDPPPFVDRV